MGQLLPGANEEPQRLAKKKSSRSAPAPRLREILVIVNGLVPVFCSVSFETAIWNRGTLPKLMLPGLTTAVAPPETVSVKFWITLLPTPFVAVKVIGNVPPTVATPLSVAVPFPLSRKLKPVGKTPLSVIVGAGNPVAATVNEAGIPAVKFTLFVLVIAGDAFTVRLNVCVPSGPTPLNAVTMSGYVPLLVGVPLRVAVPSPLSANVTPSGKSPVAISAGSGSPVVVTVNVPGDPVRKAALGPLVIVGACAGVLNTANGDSEFTVAQTMW
jgi:hypothetical protein